MSRPPVLTQREKRLLRWLRALRGSKVVKRTSGLTPGAPSLDYRAAEHLVELGVCDWAEAPYLDYGYRLLKLVADPGE